MASVNQATVIGFVGDEPKIVNAQNGTKIAALSVATTDKGYTKQDGTTISDKTEWHNVVLFGRLAEVVEKYVHKGASVYVQGKMRTRSYDDKNGVKRYVTEINADTFQMLDRKNDSQQQQPTTATTTPYQQPPQRGDDDLPF